MAKKTKKRKYNLGGKISPKPMDLAHDGMAMGGDISKKIAKLIREGKKPDQAAAIAYSMKRREELGLGGDIGSAAGAVIGAAVPGLQPFTPLLSAAGGALGSLFDGTNTDVEQLSQGQNITQNPYGNFRMGGNFEKLSPTTLAVEGKTHEQGGEQYGNIEVEDEETIDQANQRVVSNKITMNGKPLAKIDQALARLSGRLQKRPAQDKITNNTLKAVESKRNNLYNMQEQFKMQNMPQEMKYGGKYQTGGPIPKNEFGFYGDITPEMISPYAEALGLNVNDPAAIKTFQQNAGILPDSKVGPQTYGAMRTQATNAVVSGLPQTDSPIDPAEAVSVTKTLGKNLESDFSNFQDMQDGVAGNTIAESTTATGEGIKSTTGDWMQIAGQAIPALYNIGAGLFGKAKKQEAYTDKSPVSRFQINPQAGINQIRLSTPKQFGRKSINTEQALQQNAAAVEGQNISDFMGRIEKINKQLAESYENRLGNRSRFNAQIKTRADVITDQNQAAKQNQLATGIGQAGQALVSTGQLRNNTATQNMVLGLINDIAPNYYFSAEDINKLTQRIIPTGLPEDIQAKFRQAMGISKDN